MFPFPWLPGFPSVRTTKPSNICSGFVPRTGGTVGRNAIAMLHGRLVGGWDLFLVSFWFKSFDSSFWLKFSFQVSDSSFGFFGIAMTSWSIRSEMFRTNKCCIAQNAMRHWKRRRGAFRACRAVPINQMWFTKTWDHQGGPVPFKPENFGDSYVV